MTKPTTRRPSVSKGSRLSPLTALNRGLSKLDVAISAELGSLAFMNTVGTPELDDAAVSLPKIAQIASSRVLGRVTAGTGVVETLTPTQLTTLIDAFTSSLKGVVPPSGGSVEDVLHGDGTWSRPLQTVLLASDHTVASTTATEVTGLQATLTAGTYSFEYDLFSQTSDANVGLKVGVNYTGTATSFLAARLYFTNATTNSTGLMVSQLTSLTGNLVEHNVARTLSTTAPNLGPNTGSGGANVNLYNIVKGIIVVSDGGDLELWHGSETATTTRIMAGSMLKLVKAA